MADAKTAEAKQLRLTDASHTKNGEAKKIRKEFAPRFFSPLFGSRK